MSMNKAIEKKKRMMLDLYIDAIGNISDLTARYKDSPVLSYLMPLSAISHLQAGLWRLQATKAEDL